MRVNFLQWIPRIYLRLLRTIVLCSSTFPLLRRPRSTIILLWIIWSWRFDRFPRSIVNWNRSFRILISMRGPPRFWWSWRRHDRRHPCCQTHHKFWFCCDSVFSWILLRSFCHCSGASSRTEMAIVKQIQQMIPLITREIPLVKMSASWFWVSMHLIWILESKLIRSNNQSCATVSPGSMSHCGTPSFKDHLDHCFVVLKHIQQSFLMWR